MYHIDDNPPPQNDNKLLDRLKTIEDPYATEEYITNFNYDFDFQVEKMEEFYNIFKYLPNPALWGSAGFNFDDKRTLNYSYLIPINL